MTMKSCPKCTFENQPRRKRCELCNSPLAVQVDAEPLSPVANDAAPSSKPKKRRLRSTSNPSPDSQEQSGMLLERRLYTRSIESDATDRDDPSPSFFSSASGKPVTLSSRGQASVNASLLGDKQSVKPPLHREPDEQPKATSPPSGGSLPMFVTFSSGGKQKEWKISEKALEAAKAKLGLLDDDESNGITPPATSSAPTTPDEPPKQRARIEVQKAEVKVFKSPVQQIPSTPDITVAQRNTKTTTRALLGVTDFSDPPLHPSPAVHTGRPSFRAPAPVGSPAGSSDVVNKPTGHRAGFTTPATRGTFNVPRVSTTPSASSHRTPITGTSVVDGGCGNNGRLPAARTSKLTPICFSRELAGMEARCPLRKALPLIESVVQGQYEFPSALCCQQLQRLMSLSQVDATVCAEHFRKALWALGAHKEGTSLEWVQSMLRNVLRKLLSFEASDLSHPTITVFSPFHALVELAYRYNREFVDGHRSVLRRIAEKDSPSTTLMVLSVSNTTLAEKPGPHQATIEVTDGWYFARCNLDLPLSQFVQSGLITVGDKIVVWGASSSRDDACGPLELLHSHGSLLNLLFNGTKQAAPTAPLGALPPNTVLPVSVSSIHTNGGAVPCLSGVVTRILPKFYIDRAPRPGMIDATPTRGTVVGNSAVKIIRNSIAEAKFCGSFESQREIAYEQAISAGMGSDDAAVLMRDKFARDVSEVTTIILETGEPGEVVAIQRTTRCSGGAHHGDSDESSLPREGQRIHIFGVIPSKATNAPPPLSVKLMYVRSQFMFIIDQNPPPQVDTRFRFQVDVQSALSSLSTKVFGQMVDVIVVCVGSQIQPSANGDTAFFFCGLERNVFGVLIARSHLAAREIELPQPTPGTICIVRNATFGCFDETGEYNIVRLQANEYTLISTRTMSIDLQKRMKDLEGKRSEWLSTFDLGKKLLVDSNAGTSSSHFIRDALGGGGGSANRSSSAVLDVAAYAPNDEWQMGASSTHRAVSAPYYLRNQHATPGHYDGVKLSKSESPAASSSIMRPLFDTSSTMSSSPPLGRNQQKGTPEQSVEALHATFSPGHERGAAIRSPPDYPRHVFGNFTVETFSLQFDTGRVVNVHADLHCSLASITHEFSQHNTQHQWSGIALSFPSHCGPLTVHLNPSLISTLGDLISLTPQQLSALSSDDAGLFSGSRSLILGAATNAAEAWELLFCHSVVVPTAVLTVVTPPPTAPERSDSAVLDSLIHCDLDNGICRWNKSVISEAQQLLWWTDQEWHQLKVELQDALSAKLFKLSLEEDGKSVQKMFFLKDNCFIADLMAE